MLPYHLLLLLVFLLHLHEQQVLVLGQLLPDALAYYYIVGRLRNAWSFDLLRKFLPGLLRLLLLGRLQLLGLETASISFHDVMRRRHLLHVTSTILRSESSFVLSVGHFERLRLLLFFSLLSEHLLLDLHHCNIVLNTLVATGAADHCDVAALPDLA